MGVFSDSIMTIKVRSDRIFPYGVFGKGVIMKRSIALWMLLACAFGLSIPEVWVQKVILDGNATSSLKAQMELYSRWTKDEVLKAQYASFAEPQSYSSFSTAQFKEIYEEQLKGMYRMVNGELLQVKRWKIQHILVNIAPRPQLETIDDTMERIPVLYRVQIKRFLGNGLYLASVSGGRGIPTTSVVQFDENGVEYTVNTVLEAYLVRTKLAAELNTLTRGAIYSYSYQCVPDEIGESVHEPTLKEMASAIKKGLKPLVLVPTGTHPCSVCGGSGVDKQKLAAAEAAAKREVNQLGKRERTYDLLGKATTKRNSLSESKSFTAAKLKRHKPPCQTCGGDGHIPHDVFQYLAK